MKKIQKIVSCILGSLMLLSALPISAQVDEHAVFSSETVDFDADLIPGTVIAASTNVASLESQRANKLNSDLSTLANVSGDPFNLKSSSVDVRSKLVQLHGLFDTDLYVWLANLYDSDLAEDHSKYASYAGYSGEGDYDYIRIGGFYYSNSARDNDGFLPDLESTAQVLELLDNSGLEGVTNSTLGDILPLTIKEQLYHFAKSLKSYDGYYYHPQWSSVNSNRKGRDKGWGNDIIEAFSPYISTAASVVTETLVVSEQYAAAKVIDVTTAKLSATADYSGYDYSYNPDPSANSYASYSSSSWTRLKKYIDYMLFNVKDSYSMGHTITASGYGNLRGPLVTYLNILQDEYFQNGFFEKEISYNACNGVMKICGVFGGDYDKYHNADKAVSAILDIMISEVDSSGKLTSTAKSEVDAITYIYNQWLPLYKFVHQLDDADQQAIAAKLKTNAHILIDGVYQKLALFKKEDGGFSYNQDYSSATSQGVSVAVPGSRESDVNATGMAVSTVRYIYRVYQLYNDIWDSRYIVPTLYTSADGQYFVELLLDIVSDANPTVPCDHVYNAVVTRPTCEMKGYTNYTCNKCGYYYIGNYTNPVGHSYSDTVIPPTCTTEGYTLHSCDCGYSYIDSKVDALGHSCKTKVVSPTCVEQGYTELRCDCGYSYRINYTEPTGHRFKYTVEEPTCTKGGKTVGECRDCHIITITDETEPLGHDYVDGVCQNCNDGATTTPDTPAQPAPEKPNTIRRRMTFAEAIAAFFKAIGDFFRDLFGIK